MDPGLRSAGVLELLEIPRHRSRSSPSHHREIATLAGAAAVFIGVMVAQRLHLMEWLILLIAIVLGIPAITWLAQDRLIFFPQPIASTAHIGTEIAPLEIISGDGTRLHGWV